MASLVLMKLLSPSINRRSAVLAMSYGIQRASLAESGIGAARISAKYRLACATGAHACLFRGT